MQNFGLVVLEVARMEEYLSSAESSPPSREASEYNARGVLYVYVLASSGIASPAWRKSSLVTSHSSIEALQSNKGNAVQEQERE